MEAQKNPVATITYKKIHFFERVTFICNLFFAVCVLVRYTSFLPAEFIPSTIIILGWILSFFLNIITLLIFIVLLVKDGRLHVPAWLFAANLLSLIAQIFIYFIVPG